tara:strand:+ start:4726 stop:5139 length:414 start_codon:yes stop_codon:yes gene_type:complete
MMLEAILLLIDAVSENEIMKSKEPLEIIKGIIDNGVDYDYRFIGEKKFLSDMKDFFDGESFETKILENENALHISKGVPVAKVILADGTGIYFEFFDITRGFQIILLTIHFFRSTYRGLREAIEDCNTEVLPFVVDE